MLQNYLSKGSLLGNRGKWAARTAHPHRKTQTITPMMVSAIDQDQVLLASALSWSRSAASLVLLAAASTSSAMRLATRSSNN